MKVIRFEIQGLVNSYRIPFFRTYHKSFLAPPKTTLIGMLCNISLKSQKEFFEILDKELIEISIVINEIKGKAKDLWRYKTLKPLEKGKRKDFSVVRRDKLFLPSYLVYLKIEDEEFYNEILENLNKPKNTPSLGMDDELIEIKNIKQIELTKNDTNKINSVFLDKGIKYKSFVKDLHKNIEFPILNITPTKFIGFDKKNKRIPKESKKDYEFNQVEYLNCEIEFQDEVKTFVDNELENKLVFY
ncbi:CRISPR-associated protein Cas5 [Malaciobacter halophilus]|uniref:CRISPR-associated protein Cas5 n=1 Tax=Malaciobacter halophilus TaxID=197482 RepID=A0A2N1J008_9BACT|nr:CRISPR-associated protein Cas5 [Malaciobacter halophilus]AXH10454.1 CRISPR/Cas system-associated RAMP protein Cas5, type I-B [Malaciobacter halophilus]PKI79887.1 CRISPR-associated protein Cas5 [Malaciobacter halophilus]